MNAKRKKELEASYGKYSREESVAALATAQAYLAAPGDDAKEEAIQGAKDSVEFFTDKLATFENPKPEEKPAKEQTFEEKHAELIRQKMNAGLTREGAIEVIKHQIENDARLAKSKKK